MIIYNLYKKQLSIIHITLVWMLNNKYRIFFKKLTLLYNGYQSIINLNILINNLNK